MATTSAASAGGSTGFCSVEAELERAGFPLRVEQLCDWTRRRRDRPVQVLRYRFPPHTFESLRLVCEDRDVIVVDDAATAQSRDETVFGHLRRLVDGAPARGEHDVTDQVLDAVLERGRLRRAVLARVQDCR